MSHNRDLSAAAAQLGFHSSNIGIGSEAPRYALDVYNTNLLVSGPSAGNIILEDRSVGDSSKPFHVVSSDGGKFVINRSNRNASGTTTSSVNSLTLSSNGNLGLGPQTNPTSNIHIADLSANGYELKISGNALQFNRSSNSYVDQLHDTGSILFRMGSSYAEAMRITSAGHVNIGGASPSSTALTVKMDTNKHIGFSPSQGEVSNVPALVAFQDNGSLQDMGFRGVTLRFATGNSERLRITNGGVVKINNPGMAGGTNAANALLQIKATGQYDGLVFGNVYSQGAIGTNSQGALIYTGNAAPANLGGGLKHTHIWYSGSSGGGGPSEKMSLSTDGTLYLGPYDAPGSYTTAANNVPYSIKVAPYGWQHHSELAAISMGNHSGSTGNDDGEIVFKTAKDLHSSTTGLVERLRIDSNGDAIFYGNPSIDATDLYYTNSYSTNGWSTSNWYTVVPHSLTSNSTYLVVLVWDWGGSHGQPYYLATQQLYSTVNGTNGTGSENELTPMCSTHTGSTGARIRCRVLAQNSGSPAMQVNMNYTMGSNSYLKVKVWKMTFLNRS